MFFIIKKKKKTYSSNEVIIPSFIEYLFIKTAIKNRNIFILDVGLGKSKLNMSRKTGFLGLRSTYMFFILFFWDNSICGGGNVCFEHN